MTEKGTTRSKLQQIFLRARDVSVPLALVRSADPAATVLALSQMVATPNGKEAPSVQWDAARGFEPITKLAEPVVLKLQPNPKMPVLNPFEALLKAYHVEPHTTIFFQNLPEFWRNDPQVRQAFWNLRDPFKRNWRMAVALTPSEGVPTLLEHDVLTIDEPLPGPDELEVIVLKQLRAANLTVPDADVIRRAVDAVAGLSAFAAEQAVALSLVREGIDLLALRERHRHMIENTKGLHVYAGSDKFDGLGGLRSVRQFLARFRSGRYKFGSVFWIDEIEKAFGGLRGDLTGITQDYLGVLLSYMQDHEVPGMLFMGHPGTGKSAMAKALGAEAGVPTIRADLQGMHGSLVGESQHALRHALKVVSAVSQGRPLFVATCNSVAILPPEFVNRFKFRFFFDLPDEEEKATIWPLHLKRRQLDARQPKPDDGQWNGREIEQCAETAHQLNISLVEAAQYVVPIAVASAEAIEQRRQQANGRYLSASRPGVYGCDLREEVTVGGRNIKLKDDTTWAAPGSGKTN